MKQFNRTQLRVGLSAGLALLSVAGVTWAKPGDSKMSGKMSSGKMSSGKSMAGMRSQMTGTVVSVAGNRLTAQPMMKKKGGTQTITVPSSAKCMMGSMMCKPSEIKPGSKVTVMMSKGTVTKVMVHGGNMMHGGKMHGGKMHGGKMHGKINSSNKM